MGLFSKNNENISADGFVRLENGKLKAVISPFGTTIKQLWYGDTLIASKGITIGRYANRIGGARFELNGKEYVLPANENSNILHGGPGGFAKRRWDVVMTGKSAARFRMVSEDGDQGFPGTLILNVTFTLTNTEKLVVDYEAESFADTVVNFTNHMYFNLNGGSAAEAHKLQINADHIAEMGPGLIPTGKLLPVEGTRFDYREMRDLVPSYDDCFAINGSGIRTAARLFGSISGIQMEVRSDQPAMQLYNTQTEVCLETQHFPDSPNRPEFPTTVLKAGDIFRTRTEYCFSCAK